MQLRRAAVERLAREQRGAGAFRLGRRRARETERRGDVHAAGGAVLAEAGIGIVADPALAPLLLERRADGEWGRWERAGWRLHAPEDLLDHAPYILRRMCERRELIERAPLGAGMLHAAQQLALERQLAHERPVPLLAAAASRRRLGGGRRRLAELRLVPALGEPHVQRRRSPLLHAYALQERIRDEPRDERVKRALLPRRHTQAQLGGQHAPGHHLRGRREQQAEEAPGEQVLPAVQPDAALLYREQGECEHLGLGRCGRQHREPRRAVRCVVGALDGLGLVAGLGLQGVDVGQLGLGGLGRRAARGVLLSAPERVLFNVALGHHVVGHVPRLGRGELDHQVPVEERLDEVEHGLLVVLCLAAELHDRDSRGARAEHELQHPVCGRRDVAGRIGAEQHAADLVPGDIHPECAAVLLE